MLGGILGAALRGGARSWSPLDLGASLFAFWDAELASSLTLTGSAVTTWSDRKSGLAPTQSTSGFKPIWSSSSFNGRPGVTFDGTDDFLELAGVGSLPAGANPCEIWVLFDQTVAAGSTGNRYAFAYGNGDAAENGFARRAVGRTVDTGVNRGRILTDASGPTAVSANDAAVDLSGRHVLRYVYTGTHHRLDVDGNAGTPAAVTATTGSERIRIGALVADVVSNFTQGTISAVLVTLPLAGPDVPLLAYLKSRGGIT
jgi:hypothetical protein